MREREFGRVRERIEERERREFKRGRGSVVNSKAVGWLAGKIQRREEKGKEKKKKIKN